MRRVNSLLAYAAIGAAAVGFLGIFTYFNAQVESLDYGSDNLVTQNINNTPKGAVLGAAAITNGLELFYNFDDGTAADSSGKGRNGTLINNPSTTTGADGSTALQFNGTNNYVTGPSNLSFASGNFTISAWFKTTATMGRIAGKWNNFSSINWEILVDQGNITGLIYDGGYKDVTSSGTYNDDQWHHVALVVGASQLELFVDGVSQGTDVHDGSIVTNTTAITVGSAPRVGAQGYLAGAVDEFAIFSRALSNSEVQTLANSGSTPPPVGESPVISSFTASPATITSGQSSTLSWSVSGADSLSINQGVGSVTGSSQSVNPAATTTYTLTATNSNGSSTANVTVTVNAAAPTTVSAPVFNPNGGDVNDTDQISITSATSGATIRFTDDGSTPTPTHGVVYSGAFTLNASKTIKAIAYKSGLTDSNVTTAVFNFVGGQPVTPPSGNNISIDSSTTYQTFVGWQASAETGIGDNISSGLIYNDAALNAAVDLGINRVRVGLQSGLTENNFDYYQALIDNGEDVVNNTTPPEYAAVRANRRVPVNDNNDPNVINPNGFKWGYVDWQIDNIVLPLRQKLAARGESLWFQITFVHFATTNQLHVDNAAEYGELILATWQHIQQKYGFVPDGLEVFLEPDNGSAQVTEAELGAMIVAARNRLVGAGFAKPVITAPSTVSGPNARLYYNNLKAANPTAASYIDEIGYHRYVNIGDTSLAQLKAVAEADGKKLAMTEFGGADYIDLHSDLKVGNNVAWEQYTISYPTTDNGFQHFYITGNHPNYQLNIGSRTKFLRQYMQYIRPGAVRLEAQSGNSNFDPIVFRNANGRYTTVVKAAVGGSFTVNNLPNGNYGIYYTTASNYDVHLADQNVTSGSLNTSIPAAGVITIYAKSGGAVPTQVSAPVFSPNGGTVTTSQQISITSATSGATIRFTDDGSTPTTTHGVVYNGAFTINASKTIKAIAYKSGMSDSQVTTASFTVNAQPPANQSPIGSLDGVHADGTIYGWAQDPDNTSTPITVHLYFDGPAGQGSNLTTVVADDNRQDVGDHAFNVPVPTAFRDGQSHTVYAYGIDLTSQSANAALSNSPVTFTIQLPPADAPTFSPNGGTVTTSQQISITSATSGATIRFTDDGSTPTTTHGVVYSGAFTINASKTIKAIAYRSGSHSASNVSTASFTVASQPPAPNASCDLYVSTTGTSSGDGSVGNPWDLQTALLKPSNVVSGQTICMRGGTYNGRYKSNLVNATLRSYPGEWAKIDGEYSTTSTADIGGLSTDRTLIVAGTYQFLQGQAIMIEDEMVQISQNLGNNTYRVNRGWGGTAIVAHSAGARVYYGTENQIEVNGSGTIYRDFEVYSSNPNRRYDYDPGNQARSGTGMHVFGPDTKIINVVVHDNLNGIFLSENATNTELYGVITYNNGFVASDRPHGHGLYMQEDTTQKNIFEVISFNNYVLGMKAYGANQGNSNHFHFKGIISFNNGTPGAYPGNPNGSTNVHGNLEVGSDVHPSQDIIIEESYTYHRPTATVTIPDLWIGRASGNTDLIVRNNYIVNPDQPLNINSWSNVTGYGNTFVNNRQDGMNVAGMTGNRATFNWDNNTYYSLTRVGNCFGGNKPAMFQGFGLQTQTCLNFLDFNEWKQLSGLDANSTYTRALPTGKQIFVRPNIYEPGRAHIAVYNWDHSNAVSVSLNNAGLTPGQQFEIRKADDFFGAPVLSNQTYSAGMSVNLPMNDLRVAAPYGNEGYVPPSTCPEFCAFVVMPLSAGVSQPEDTTDPTVSLTAPANGATVSGNVTISATASDNVGVAGVQFKVNGANAGVEDTNSPYSVTWDSTAVNNGSYTITAVARDAAGNTKTSSSRTVTVNNTVPAVATPSISPNGGTFVTTQDVTLNTSTSGATIRYTTNGSDPTSGSTQYTGPITLSNTTTIKARAFKSGMTDSAVASATFTKAADTTDPSVSITSPVNNASVSGIVTVTANASDNVGVTGVQFKLDGNNLGSEDTAAPYSISWNTVNAANGAHVLTAVARDAAGNTKTSTDLTVTVNNSIPTVATPTITPNGGKFVGTQTVTIQTSTSGATIRYTTNGSNPTSSSAIYSGPLSLTATTTVKAKAFRSGYNDSAIASATFTKTAVNQRPTGSLDGIHADGTLYGWAHDPDNTDAPVMIHFYIDSPAGGGASPSFTTTADSNRQDVGNHAFNVAIPAQYRDGQQHRVYAYAIDLTEPNDNNQQLDPTNGIAFTLTLANDDDTAPVISQVSVPSPTIRHKGAVVKWTTDEAATSQIEYGLTTSYGMSTPVNANLTTSHNMMLRLVLQPNKVYHYRVKSTDAAGNQSVSQDFTFTTLPRLAKPPKPTGLQARSGSVILEWQSVDYDLCENIVIFRSTQGYINDPALSEPLATIDCVDTSYSDEDVVPSTKYYYSLFTVDDVGTYSEPQTITFTTPSGGSSGGSSGGGGGGGGGSSTPQAPTTPTTPTAPSAPASSSSVVLPANVISGQVLKFNDNATVYLVQSTGLHPFASYDSLLSYMQSSGAVVIDMNRSVSPYTVSATLASTILQQTPVPSEPAAGLPADSSNFVCSGDPTVYFYYRGQREAYPEAAVFEIWNGNNYGSITTFPASVCNAIPYKGMVRLPEGTIVVVPGGSEVYRISGNTARPFTSYDALVRDHGSNPVIHTVSLNYLHSYSRGEDIH